MDVSREFLCAPSLAWESSKSEATWVCEMTRGEIDLRQSDDMDVLVVSDEALEEAACGGLMRGSPTLAYGSYCFACRPHFYQGWLSTP